MVLIFDCNAQNRRVALITNVKPGKLRDVMSEGLVRVLLKFSYLLQFVSCDVEMTAYVLTPIFQVLCASNEDHTVVEPLLPPEGAKIGERVTFSG